MQKKTLDLVAIGECLVEFAQIGPQLYRQDYSGDVLNALWMASRLGLRTGLVSSVGDDPFTERLMSVLHEGRIDTSVVERLQGRSNGIYYVLEDEGSKRLHFQRKASAATQTFKSRVQDITEYLRSSNYVLFSAIPLAVIEARETMLATLREIANDATICFDTNVRLALWPDISELRQLVTDIAPAISVLFVSREDDLALFGERSPEDALAYYEGVGYQTIILRRGSESVMARHSGRTIEAPTVRDVTVVDATGAGDAFNAGFIAAQIEGKDLEGSLAFANASAASVPMTNGGRAYDVTREEVQKLETTIRDGVKQ
jgi:2-dehydro-3-deoxygluconokinase